MSSDSDSDVPPLSQIVSQTAESSKKKKKKTRVEKWPWTNQIEKFYLDLLVEGLPKRINGVWLATFFDSCIQRFEEKGFPVITVK
jgi:hypothetical protein